MKKVFAAAVFSLFAVAGFAQQTPHLAYVYPAGGRAGSTFQVVVGGQYLLSASNAFISGAGVTATVLDASRPMNFQDFSKLRDRLKELQEKFQASRRGDSGTNAWMAADAKEREPAVPLLLLLPAAPPPPP